MSWRISRNTNGTAHVKKHEAPKAYSAVAVHQNGKRVTLSVQRVGITLLDGELALGSHLVVMVEEKK